MVPAQDAGSKEVSERTQGCQRGTCHLHKPEGMSVDWDNLGKRPTGAETLGVYPEDDCLLTSWQFFDHGEGRGGE